MKFLKTILIFLAVALAISSCSKGATESEDSNHVVDLSDNVPPVVEIQTPTVNQSFTSGSTISISGKITDNLGLYRGTIKVTNDGTGDVLKSQEYEIHGLLAYNYSLSYTPIVTKASDYTISVEFEDHGLNTTKQEVKVKVSP